jgi:triosephosphate isomerase (TIM)
MQRKPIIAANWKMHMTPLETTEFLRPFLRHFANREDYPVEIVICPPFVSLPAAREHIHECQVVGLGAQNMSSEPAGAYTGEVSAKMLKEVEVEYVILGHSERRQLFGETDEGINRKIHTALDARLTPIFCIGETLEEREGGKVEEILQRQLTGGLAGIGPTKADDIVIAYEPVWAIGTGRTATPEIAQQTHAFARKVLAGLYGADTAAKIRIQYGGSVKPNNTAELMAQPDIDGALVGGASLDVQGFYEIIRNTVETMPKA